MPRLELYGAKSCPYTAELQEELEWQGEDFDYYNVEDDKDALQRLLKLTGCQRSVPVLVEDGKAKEIGFRGRGCPVGAPSQ
jgi:glutaredoxin 3